MLLGAQQLRESAPVAGGSEFIQLANDMAQQLATGPGAKVAQRRSTAVTDRADGRRNSDVKSVSARDSSSMFAR